MKQLLVVGLCVFLLACSTGRYAGTDMSNPQEDPTVLGIRYLLGRGVAQNDQKAFYYFHQAAQQEDVFAENEVAYMYAAGKGTRQDYNRSFYYYHKAASQGLSSAQYSLGLLYAYGLGTNRDLREARYWWQKSAAQGFLPAKRALEHYRGN